MSELETLKQENEKLKAQMTQNSAGIHGLLSQLDAHKGELADARTISLQLRTNLIMFQKSNNELVEKVKALEAELAAVNEKAPDPAKMKKADKAEPEGK